MEQKNSELAKIESDVLKLQLKINDDIGALKELEQLKSEKQAEANFCESWLVSARLLPPEYIPQRAINTRNNVPILVIPCV
ncbi:hypothetical protein C0993_009382 [Termitomyces sp. T159_Od127]|nr:hypothetical protein C0993_009382 [Termitomyces sp. T159_Od127]